MRGPIRVELDPRAHHDAALARRGGAACEPRCVAQRLPVRSLLARAPSSGEVRAPEGVAVVNTWAYATAKLVSMKPAVRSRRTGLRRISGTGRGQTIYATTRSTGQIEEGPVGFSIANLDNGVVSWKYVLRVARRGRRDPECRRSRCAIARHWTG
jgi:hypothetical protein